MYQALKSDDPGERKSIENHNTPLAAKKAGHRAKIREDWENIKLQIME